ncbi:MAG: hypothetical protein Q8L60_12765 [Gammaproteobacteria bacterium]|nr:hypothetical protein [Gammaproteobacteria bacterium]MDP2140919.1 hypothetical protein [Gammaproteobacteria bacterium]MDP2349337.1 hypothetical protein [Gammaproteobacteria bacterium]
MLSSIATWISESQGREFANWLLTNIPGLPPILQTIHLLSIAAIMASIVMVDLRVLGLGVLSQNLEEMVVRLQAWMWCGVVGAACSGVWFVFARPNRYFFNPVFQIKFSLLLPALLVSAVFYHLALREPAYWSRNRKRAMTAKLLALVSLLLWLGVVMAGRWIAYSEYLFWPE